MIAQDGILLATSWKYIDGHPRYHLSRSDDNGDTWTDIIGQFPAGRIPVTVHPGGNGLVYAIGQNEIWEEALFSSVDGGESWDLRDGLLDGKNNLLACSNGYLFMGQLSGIWRSLDSGRTWTLRNNGLTLGDPRDQTYRFITRNSSDDLVVTTPAGLFTSTDYGESWTPLARVRAVAYNANPPVIDARGRIYVTVWSGDGLDSLYRSTDHGASWERLKAGTYPVVFVPEIDGVVILTHPGNGGYAMSTDAGSTWSDWYGSHGVSLPTYDGSRYYYMAETAGPIRSESLYGPWELKTDGFPETVTEVVSIVRLPGGGLLAGTRSIGLFRSTNDGGTFAAGPPGLRSAQRLVATPGGSIIALSGGFIRRSTDDGLNWSYNSSFGTATELAGSGNLVFVSGKQYNGDASLNRSVDGGLNYSTVHWTSGMGGGLPHSYPFVGVHPSGIVVAGRTTSNTRIPFNSWHTILVSADSGLTWIEGSSSLPATPAVRGFAVGSTGRLFITTANEILRSDDTGATWTPVDGAVPAADLRCLVIDSADRITVGTGKAGVFRSTDQGDSWFPETGGMNDTTVNTLYIDPSGVLFAGTESRGVFRAGPPDIPPDEDPGSVPTAFRLSAGFPNPFNPGTRVRYSLPAAGAVTLRVYDVRGRLVSTLVDEVRSAGIHEASFDGSNFGSGVYYCRMEAGSFTAITKLLLLR